MNKKKQKNQIVWGVIQKKTAVGRNGDLFTDGELVEVGLFRRTLAQTLRKGEKIIRVCEHKT